MRRGGGRAFVAAISGLHETLKREIGSAFTSDEYRGETAKTQQEFNGQRQEAMQAAERYASERGFAIQMSQIGMAVIPVADGQPLDQAQFMALPDEERAALEEGRRDVTGRVEATVRQVQEIGRSQGEALEALAQRVGELTVQAPFETLFATHGQDEDVTGFLNGLREYTLAHLDVFQTAEDHPGETDGAAAAFPPRPSRNPFRLSRSTCSSITAGRPARRSSWRRTRPTPTSSEGSTAGLRWARTSRTTRCSGPAHSSPRRADTWSWRPGTSS
jgi:hypothetical protein